MITKILTLIASSLAGFTMMFSSPGATLAQLDALQGPETPELGTWRPPSPPDFNRLRDWLYRGDPRVREGLVLATVSATSLRPLEVIQALEDGQSILGIAESAGSSSAEVLSIYNETAEHLIERAVENGRLPQSLAQIRIEWYQNVAGLMIDQPGLSPAYPGLHELNVTIITAAVRVGELTRWEVRDGLHACRSLDEILVEGGHSGPEAVEQAMRPIQFWLDKLVEQGKLSDAQRQEWEASLESTLEQMVSTPGLHVAGRECAE